MTAKFISIRWAGALVVGGMFWLGGQSSWAAEEPTAAGQIMPAPAAVPATPPQMVPGPASGQPPASPLTEGATPSVADDGCSEFCGAPVCSPPGRYWLRTDYLMWWTNGMRLPPLVTTSPQNATSDQAGVLGQTGTTILFGGSTVGDDIRSGFHTTLGMWLDDCRVWDLEFDYLSLGERSNGFSQTSTGNPILARPFLNLQLGRQGSELVAYPGQVEGSVAAEARQYFQAAGVWLSRNLCSCNSCEPCGSCDPSEELCGGACNPPMTYGCRTDVLMGFRYYNLSSFVGVTENLRITQPSSPLVDSTLVIRDTFRARNDFYGSELGLRTQIYRGRWSLEILTKLAMGNNHQTITIDGTTAITAPGSPTINYATGVLAGGVNTNGGVYQRDTFTVIPQLGLELGYQVNCHWRAYVGFDLLYWGAVAQAGDQIDLNADPRNFPPSRQAGLPFPQFSGKNDCFWAQGLHLGTEFRF